ncbi:MAG TPA: sigma-70 family RNA polymerase sigma factor [Candidatus Angelobacter sp.]
MNVHVSYKSGKTSDVEREFEIQSRKLERRLRVFKPDLVHLHAIVDQQNGQGPSTSLNLRLPSGQMAVQQTAPIGENVLAALKAAFNDLFSQLTRHKDMLRGQWTRSLRRDAKAETAAAMQAAAGPTRRTTVAPAPPKAAAPGDLESWVNAGMGDLKTFIERELRFRAAAGQIREDQITTEEVVDEVMLSALSKEDGGGQLLSQESWFGRLALEAIRRLTEDNADTANVSLDAPARAQNVSGSDENFLQYHQPDDQPPEEAVISDAGVRTPEEIYASEEMVAQLDRVLREVGTRDREAFILYTLEGFTVDEIARLSDRPPDQVRKSIHHARERVQQKLPERNQFRRSLLSRSRVA